MATGLFDDLMPGGKAAAPAAALSDLPTSGGTGLFDDLLPKPPGFFSTVGRNFARGLVEGGKEVAETATGPFTDRAHPAAPEPDAVDKAREETNYLSPTWLASNIAHGLGRTAPSFATGAAGAIAGGAMAGPPGALAGGALGFGGGAAFQALGTAYARATAEGLDHEAAVDRAIKEAGIEGLTGAAMGAAPGVATMGRTTEGAFRKPISEALAQVFGVQPAIGAAGQVATGAVEGKPPTTSELVRGYALNAATGAVLGAPHMLHRRGRETPDETEAPPPSEMLALPPPSIPMGEGAPRVSDAALRAEYEGYVKNVPTAVARQRGAPPSYEEWLGVFHPDIAAPKAPLALPPPRPLDAADRATIARTTSDAGADALGPSETPFVMRNQSHPLDLVQKYENPSANPLLGWGNTDLSRYPLTETGFPDWPGKAGPKGNSTAAGLYQITKTTWDPIAKRLGITDFSPESQRAVADELYRTRGLQPWEPNNPRLAAAIARGEVADVPVGKESADLLALPPPLLALPKPETTYGDNFLMSESKKRVQEAPKAAQSPLDLASIAVQQLEPGAPVTRRMLGEWAGVRSMDQIGRLRDRLVNSGLVSSQNGRYLRAQTINEPERLAPRIAPPATEQSAIQLPAAPAPMPGPTAEARTPPAPPPRSTGIFDDLVPQKPDNKPGNYYVTAIRDGKKAAYLAGPYRDDHASALAAVERAREAANRLDPFSEFDAFGTARTDYDFAHPGRLNEHLGELAPSRAESPLSEVAAAPETAPPAAAEPPPPISQSAFAAERPAVGVPRSQWAPTDLGPPAREPRQSKINTAAPTEDALVGSLDRADATRNQPRLSPDQIAVAEGARAEMARRFEEAAQDAGSEISDWLAKAKTYSERAYPAAPGRPPAPSRVSQRRGFMEKITGRVGERLNRDNSQGRSDAEKWLKDNPKPDVGTAEVRVPHGRGGETILTLPRDEQTIRSVAERYGKLPPDALYQRPGTETVPGVVGEGAGSDRTALKDELYRLIKERAPTLRLRTFDDLFGMVEGRASPIHGAYHTDERPGGLAEHIAVIALGGPDAKAALSHEITHFLRHAGLFTKQEWSVLSGKADKWGEQFKVNERYSDQPLGIRREEAIAEAYAAWHGGELQLPPGLRRIFGKAKDFFEKVGNFLRGNGYQSSEDVFQRMTAGEVGNRPMPDETGQATMHARPAAADDRIETALKAIRVSPDERPLAERSLGFVKQAVNRIRDEARYAAIDSFDPIAKLEKGEFGKLRDASVSAFKAAHLSRELPAMMSQVVGIPNGKGGFFGGVPMLKDGAYVTNPGSKPLSAVLKPIFDAGLQKPFELWMAVTRGARLMAEGRENLIPREMIAEFRDLDQKHLGPNGENLFRQTQKEWIKFNDQLLDFAEQAGLVNKEQRALWQRGDYVPFFRNMGEESPLTPGKGPRGIANQSSGIKALTGGTEKLNSLYENMFSLSESLIGRAVKNEAGRRTRDLAEPLGAMNKVSLAEKMASQGKRGDNVVSVMDGGKQQYYRVTQPLLYKAITAFGPVEANKVTQLLGMPKALLTKMVTHEPTFMAANLMRDTLHAWVVTGADFKPGLDSAKGAISALRNSPSAMAIMAGGGGGPHFYAKDAAGFVRDLEGNWTPLSTPRKLWDQLERVGSASEMANRIAVYEAALKRGDSNAEAIWQSKDLLNFTASGGSELMKFLIQTVPFMNARIQGLDRLQRGFRENPASFLMRGGLITAASLGLWALNKDNPEYQQLPDFEKQSYWHLFLPGMALRIPKPFEAGAIFGSVPEMLGDYADNGNWNQLWRAFVANLSQQLNLSPIPQALAPAYDVARNVNSLTDAPIVSEGEKHLVPGERAGPNSSATMKALGQQIGASPDQLEYLFKGYTGTLGSYLLSSADALTNAATGAVRPETRIEQYPFVGRFVRAEPILANRWINGFYDIKTEVDQLHATMNSLAKEGRAGEAQQLVKDNIDKLSLYQTTQSVGHQLTAVRQAMKQINDAPNLSSTEKRERLDQLVAVRNRIGESAREIVTRARP